MYCMCNTFYKEGSISFGPLTICSVSSKQKCILMLYMVASTKVQASSPSVRSSCSVSERVIRQLDHRQLDHRQINKKSSTKRQFDQKTARLKDNWIQTNWTKVEWSSDRVVFWLSCFWSTSHGRAVAWSSCRTFSRRGQSKSVQCLLCLLPRMHARRLRHARHARLKQ
jgi:hypothetical protein